MKNGILNVKIENFKKIENLEVELNGSSAFLMGDNEVGKSSFLQAVFSLLSNGELPEKTITTGKEKGSIITTIQVDGKKYKVTRTFTQANQKGYFQIESEDGMKSKELSFLEKLVGNIAFNPFEFADLAKTAEGRRKQVKLIRQLLPKEANEKIDKIDSWYKQKFEERAELNREIKLLNTQLEQIQVTPADLSTYSKEVSIEETAKALTDANETNNKIKDLEAVIEKNEKDLNLNLTRIEDYKKVIKSMEDKNKELEKENKTKALELGKIDPVPVKDIEDKLKTASDHNKKHETVKQYNEKSETYNTKKTKSEDLSVKLSKCVIKKADIVFKAKLPVEGLTFDEDGIYLNGLPVDENQISTSQIVDLGIKISVAINPALKVLRIPRGESLGTAKLKAIQDFVKENNYQVFIEKVDASFDKLTIRIFEE